MMSNLFLFSSVFINMNSSQVSFFNQMRKKCNNRKFIFVYAAVCDCILFIFCIPTRGYKVKNNHK